MNNDTTAARKLLELVFFDAQEGSTLGVSLTNGIKDGDKTVSGYGTPAFSVEEALKVLKKLGSKAWFTPGLYIGGKRGAEFLREINVVMIDIDPLKQGHDFLDSDPAARHDACLDVLDVVAARMGSRPTLAFQTSKSGGIQAYWQLDERAEDPLVVRELMDCAGLFTQDIALPTGAMAKLDNINDTGRLMRIADPDFRLIEENNTIFDARDWDHIRHRMRQSNLASRATPASVRGIVHTPEDWFDTDVNASLELMNSMPNFSYTGCELGREIRRQEGDAFITTHNNVYRFMRDGATQSINSIEIVEHLERNQVGPKSERVTWTLWSENAWDFLARNSESMRTLTKPKGKTQSASFMATAILGGPDKRRDWAERSPAAKNWLDQFFGGKAFGQFTLKSGYKQGIDTPLPLASSLRLNETGGESSSIPSADLKDLIASMGGVTFTAEFDHSSIVTPPESICPIMWDGEQQHLFNPGIIVQLFAEPNVGKSIAALAFMKACVMQGQDCVYIDSESGVGLFNKRHAQMRRLVEGATGRIHYVNYSPENQTKLLPYLYKMTGLVVVDSLNRVISRLGGDNNSSASTGAALEGLFGTNDQRASAQCAFMYLDHIYVKSSLIGQAKTGQGSSIKLADADLTLKALESLSAPLTKGETGLVQLRWEKTRDSDWAKKGPSGAFYLKLDSIVNPDYVKGVDPAYDLHIMKSLEYGQWFNDIDDAHYKFLPDDTGRKAGGKAVDSPQDIAKGYSKWMDSSSSEEYEIDGQLWHSTATFDYWLQDIARMELSAERRRAVFNVLVSMGCMPTHPDNNQFKKKVDQTWVPEDSPHRILQNKMCYGLTPWMTAHEGDPEFKKKG